MLLAGSDLSHTSSNVKTGKECCWQTQIADASAAVLCGRNFAGWLRSVTQAAMLKWGRNVLGGSDQKHTGSNVMGKENCWQVHIRVKHAAMLGEGKVLADSDHKHIRIDICSDLIRKN